MIKRIKITSPKVKKEVKILLISDIHKSKYFKKDNLIKLKNSIKDFNEIDYIIIPGDIVDSPKYLVKEEFVNELTNSIKSFIEDKPTYIVLGNHDIVGNNPKEEYLYQILNRIDNVKCLDNEEIINIKDISIKGFVPSKSYFKKRYNRKNVFEKQYKENKTDKFNKKQYNILLTHDTSSMIEIAAKNNEFIGENIDLVISGHMHNGLVPRGIQNIMNHRGIVGPYYTFFPKYAHGMMKIKNTDFIIVGAVNPIIKVPLYNKIYGSDAIVLTLKKDN